MLVALVACAGDARPDRDVGPTLRNHTQIARHNTFAAERRSITVWTIAYTREAVNVKRRMTVRAAGYVRLLLTKPIPKLRRWVRRTFWRPKMAVESSWIPAEKRDAAINHFTEARAIIAAPVGGKSGRWETEKLSATHKGRGDEKARAGLEPEWRVEHPPYGPSVRPGLCRATHLPPS
jgi:hypothetical protein